MALKYSIKTAKIEIDGPDSFIEVRGLSLNDIVQIVMLHREVVEELFGRFSGKDTDSISEQDAAEVIMEMVEKTPAVVAHVISLAADALDQYDAIVTLPLGVQVASLEKIGEFTFASGGGPKKLLGMALKMAGRAKPQSDSPQT